MIIVCAKIYKLLITNQKAPGLSLRVTANGKKTLSVNYRMPGNPIKQRHTLGTHLTISLADARALALKVIADAKMNIAPNSKLNAIKQELYIKDLIN